MRKTETHIYFSDCGLSNFWVGTFLLDNIGFASAEHAYLYLKAKHFNDEDTAQKILKAPTLYHAGELAKVVKNYDDEAWLRDRFDVMVTALEHKFSDRDMKFFLMSTTTKTLVNANPYDVIWSIGLSKDDNRVLDERNWKGQNLLGKALMEVRSRLILESV